MSSINFGLFRKLIRMCVHLNHFENLTIKWLYVIQMFAQTFSQRSSIVKFLVFPRRVHLGNFVINFFLFSVFQCRFMEFHLLLSVWVCVCFPIKNRI